MAKNVQGSTIKQSAGSKAFDILNIIILGVLAIVCLYPVWYVVCASFSEPNLMMQHQGGLILPAGFSLSSYKAVFENPRIWTGYANTLKILVISLVCQITMTSIGAYFFSRKGVLWKKPLMILITITMFISGGTIPFYQTIQDFGLQDTHWGLIIPFMISTYNMIILRTSFESIPESLCEAARIDGAGHFKILFSVILPLSKAILAVMVMYYGVGTWNGWFWGSTILSDRDMYPLQVVLREILISNDTSSMTAGTAAGDVEAISATIRYATIMVATIPILCIYPFIQKYFTKGVMVGAVKE